VFGFLLIYVAGYTIFGKEHLGRSVTLAGALVLVAALMFGATRWVDRSPAQAAPAVAANAVGGGEGGRG
jgi:hypothetical protein